MEWPTHPPLEGGGGMSTTDARFRGFVASRLGYFRNGPQWLVLDLQYSTFRY